MKVLLKQERYFALLCGGVLLLLLLGGVVSSFSGSSWGVSPIFHGVNEERGESLDLFFCSNSPFSRLLRSSRQRNNPSLRTGNDGSCIVSCCEKTADGRLLVLAAATRRVRIENKNFWIDFIISALPVRAGPACS